MKKLLMSFVIISLTLVTVALPIQANELNQQSNESEVLNEGEFFESQLEGNTIAIDNQGNYLQFNTQEERDLFLLTQRSQQGRDGRSFYGYTSTNEIIGTKYYSKQFVGYNPSTPNWSKATSYSITSSKLASIGVSLSYDGVGFTVNGTVSSGATINIKADSSRWSRLGYLGDVTAYKHRVKIYYNGVLQSTSYPISGKITTVYNTVKYQ